MTSATRSILAGRFLDDRILEVGRLDATTVTISRESLLFPRPSPVSQFAPQFRFKRRSSNRACRFRAPGFYLSVRPSRSIGQYDGLDAEELERIVPVILRILFEAPTTSSW